MRNVIIYIYERKYKDGKKYFEKIEDGKGIAKFHAWGCDYGEFEYGIGNYSTAVVERKDGTIENVPVELIKFTTNI